MKQVEITLPDRWEEVTLGQYLRYRKVDNPQPEDVVEAFCNLTKKDLRLLGFTNVQKIFNTLAQVINQPTDKFKLVYKVELNGKRYGLIPNFDKMSYGEYLDLTNYTKDTERNLDKIMSVLYRPIKQEDGKGRYLIEDYTGEEDSKVMLGITMDVVFSVLGFFFAIAKDLLSYIPTYLTKTLIKEGPIYKDLSDKDGEVINKSIRSLKETLEGLTMLHPFPSINV